MDQYANVEDTIRLVNATKTELFFGPVTLSAVTKDGDEWKTGTTFRAINLSENGALRVNKEDENGNPLAGAIFITYRFDDTQEEIEMGRATTDTQGLATFTDLPIYDEHGSQIFYYVREIQAPPGYSISKEEPHITLNAGTVTELKDSFVNVPSGSFTVTKVYYNLWEHSFTQKEYLLPGTRVALFAQDGKTYKFRELATADDLGQVRFTDLRQDTVYVAVEYDIPAEADYAYLQPQQGGYLSEETGFGDPTKLEGTSLTATQLERLNYVTYNAKDGDKQGQKDQTAKLINEEHWTQLHIKKYVPDANYTAPAVPADSQVNGERPINNAEFDLYMQVVDEELIQDGKTVGLTYVDGSADYTHIGHYSSGTLYDPATGDRMDGWFGTDVLKAADNVVYWLVERTPGIGAAIKPESQIVLIYPSGQKYSNQSKSLENPDVDCTNTYAYTRDTVNRGLKVENDPVTGPGNEQFATVRLTKWADSYDEDGVLQQDYTPLGNATFAIYLAHADGTTAALLDTVTTGLDNTSLTGGNLTAWASSYAFGYNALMNAYGELDQGDRTPEGGDIFWTDADGNAYARLILRETSAPAGYSTLTHEFRMTLFFQKVADGAETSETFNDLFYVKTTDKTVPLASTIGDDWPCYAVDADGNRLTQDDTQYRLVNLPIDNFAVTVSKYGYTVHEEDIPSGIQSNLNMTAAQLDAYYDAGTNGDDRVPLQVTMRIQRYNGTSKTWADYVYTHADGSESATFTTTDGWYAFPNGVPVGRYRLIEDAGATGYIRMYDGSAVAGDAFHNVKAYYFAVTTENLNLSLYNPRKLSLTVAKTDTTGRELEGATFRLNNLEATTDDSGYAEFENLAGGVYTLQETKPADGYSKAYLTAYLKDAYPRSEGYVYTVDANTSYALEDFATSGIYLGLQTAQQGDEPVVTNKVDLNDYQMQDPLMIAVQDPALGSLTITKTDAQKPGETLPGATFTLAYKPFAAWSQAEAAAFTDDGSGWTVKVAETDQTGAEGTVTVQNLEPGIYKITEKTAPDGYTADTSPRYAIVIGGLTQNLTWNGQTLNNRATVSDKEKVDLTVTKRLDTGSVPLQQEETFTFTLYSGTTELDSQTVTFAKGTANGATQQVTFEDLEQGGSYTLTETHRNGFVLTGITDAAGNPLTVTQDAQGNSSVSLTLPTDGTGLTVTATNRALQGSITLQKQDGSNGSPLAGATFTINRTGTPAMTPITVTTDETGSATAVVPLTGVEGNEFTITETAAPDGYVRKDNTVTLTVKPGDAASPATNEALTVNNYPGVKIQLTKYDNAREGLDPLPQAEVTFALYRQDGTAWTFVEEATTDENGVLTFTVEDGQVYSVAENPIPAGYQGLEGLWDGTGWVPTARDETRTYYLINGGEPLVLSQGTYAYDAHNVPYIRLELRKQDALHPAAETQPEATVDLYEVPADTPTTLTEEQVSALLARTDVTRVAQGVAVNLDGSDTTANSRFKYGWVDNTVVGGKTYLALETDATMTQIRDHADEVWYAVFTVPADTTGLEVVTLKNVPGRAELKLEKTTETTHYESLLAAPAQLRYTLTPTVEDNTYPLNGFVLADTGLTAYHQDTPLDFATYLQDKYAITQVTLAPSSHDGAAYSADGRQTGLQATVTFYDFAGNAVESQTVEDATRTATLTPASNSRIARVEVSYRSPALQEATGYALGQNFRPGAVTIRMTLDQQQGGVDVQEITRVVNTATATLTYNPWDGQGTKLAEQTLTRTATAENTFAELKGALISVNKTVDKDHPTQNDTLTYTIAVHNAPEAEAAMQRPFVVDLLPQGTRLEGESGNVTLIDPPAGVEIENIRISTQNGETALFVFLTGELAPGATLQLQLQVYTTAEIAVYGPEIRNYALVGSRVAGVKSVNNPHGSSYKTADNLWPYGLDTVLSSLAGTQRLESLRAMLGEMKDFGYVSATVHSNWSATSAAGLVKTGQGNLSTDLGFTSDRLSTVGNDGYMDYRLQVSNLSSADQNVHFTNVTVLDVFPFVGDRSQGGSNRGSQWEMTFATDTYAAAGNPTGVQLQRLDENGNAQILGTDQYEVFYYTGDITRDNINDVYACVEQIRFGQEAPAGWTRTPTQGATAIAIAVEKQDRSALASHGSYLAEYRLRVGNLSQEDLADRSWTNAVNNFIFTYDRYVGNQTADDAVPSNTTMLSNSVSNTILPSLVQVGGHVWIDKNADGVWQADESVDALADNALVQSLLNHVEVTLYTYEGNSDVVRQAQSYATGSDPDWYSEANFLFTGLEPASRMDNFTEDQLYSSGDNRDPLNPALLKGEAPKTYRILVTVPETSGILNQVTTLGGQDHKEQTGFSRHPDDLAPGGAHADEASDNNFFAVDGTSARNNISERFFLYATADPATQFDNTKDIGFVLQRNLLLQKVAKNDPTKTLEGATFRIYGPFATVEAANTAALTDENLVAEVTTDANGQATVPNLNWFQNYVIVETDSADYYQLDGATAANADGVLQAYTGTAAPGPAWVLGVPADNVTNQNQTVTVTNRTEVEYTLTAAKTMEGTTLRDNQFTFTLLDGQMQTLQTARNVDGQITFAPIQADRVGLFTYYLREELPAEAQGAVLDNIRYDTTLWKAEVNVGRNAQNQRLETTITYSRQNADGSWTPVPEGATFTNRYLPAFRTQYSPVVRKTFTSDSQARPQEQSFTFTLTPAESYGEAARIDQGGDRVTLTHEGVAYFAPITFTQTGTYRFTLQEVNDGKAGYTYDTTQWTLEIEVGKQDDALKVLHAVYRAEGKPSAGMATFVNGYYPPSDPPETPDEENGDGGGGGGTNPEPTQPAAPANPLQVLQQWVRSLLPQTGDDSQPLLWVVLLVVSAGCLAGIVIWRKRKK
nr:SpaA isopeptide-forming pilin-related protein [uncultured Subdoligranulum sp.]